MLSVCDCGRLIELEIKNNTIVGVRTTKENSFDVKDKDVVESEHGKKESKEGGCQETSEI